MGNNLYIEYEQRLVKYSLRFQDSLFKLVLTFYLTIR